MFNAKWIKGLWKWNESGFRPPLCTYRLNWARRTYWGWWDDWDNTVLQTQDSEFEPWRSEAKHANSRSRRLPTILTFTRGWGRNIFVSFKPPRPGTEPRTLAWRAAVHHYICITFVQCWPNVFDVVSTLYKGYTNLLVLHLLGRLLTETTTVFRATLHSSSHNIYIYNSFRMQYFIKQ